MKTITRHRVVHRLSQTIEVLRTNGDRRIDRRARAGLRSATPPNVSGANGPLTRAAQAAYINGL